MNIYCVLLKYINIPLRATQCEIRISSEVLIFLCLYLKRTVNSVYKDLSVISLNSKSLRKILV